MRFSLRTQILLLVSGTVIGLTVAVMAAVSMLAGQEVARLVRMDVRATGVALSRLLRERSKSLQDQSILIARQPPFRAIVQTADRATLVDLAHDYARQLRADAIVITDRDGNVLAETSVPSDPVPSSGSTDRSDQPGIAAALEGENWTGVVDRGDRLMVEATVPIGIGSVVWGTFTAYSAIDAGVAKDLKEGLFNSEIAFVHNGRVMGASSPISGMLTTPKQMPRPVTVNDSHYSALYAPFPNTDPSADMGFVVLRRGGSGPFLSGRTWAIFGAIAAAIVLLALMSGALVARSITKPLEGVVGAARTVRQGGWPEKFDVRRTDEVGLLQQVFNDMTASMREAQDRLLALIDTDPLTGLDNHRRFQERLAQEVKRSAASGEALSIVLIDIDNFQAYNQAYGHTAGDEALKRAGALLLDAVPEVAVAARYAGDKFALLLPQHDLDAAEEAADRLRELVNETWSEGSAGVGLSYSAGCAQFTDRIAQADGLVLAAELAVSQAKQLGRSRTCRFDSVPGAEDTSDPGQLYRFVKDGSLSTIQALAAAVDAKDPYTNGHSQRVATYAARLAEQVSLPAAEVELVYITGTLHDVGKIGIPDAILKKPGRLDAEEQAIMETHPVLGEVIVRKAPALASTLDGVRHHHERWDGRGYPDQLAGDQIPRIARLLAIADTFDAMTSDRPYRKGLDVEVALAEIGKGAGTQFDPDLAPAFVAMMQAQAPELRYAA